MKLVDRKGNARNVDIGLVDKRGAFFLLLDDETSTRYLRFSDESSALSALFEKCKRLEKQNKQLVQRINDSYCEVAQGGTVSARMAANLIGCKLTTTRKLMSDGKLRRVKVGKEFRVPLSAIEEYQTADSEQDNG